LRRKRRAAAFLAFSSNCSWPFHNLHGREADRRIIRPLLALVVVVLTQLLSRRLFHFIAMQVARNRSPREILRNRNSRLRQGFDDNYSPSQGKTFSAQRAVRARSPAVKALTS
jgi:hypothetical protein